MKDVLFNLALIDTTKYCRENGIDYVGSHLVKDGRGFKYSLIRDDKAIITVEFTKYSVPKHIVWRHL
jgi:hypothetical protein